MVLSSEMDLAEISSFHRPLLKREAWRFLERSACPPSCENELPTAHTALSLASHSLHTAVGNGAMNKFESCCHLCHEHLKPRMLLFSVGITALWTPPRYWQWRNEFLPNIRNGAMNSSTILATAQWTPPRYWKLCDHAWRCWERLYKGMGKPCSAFEKANWQKCLLSLQAMPAITLIQLLKKGRHNRAVDFGAMNFHSCVGNLFQIANRCTRWRCSFKGFSQDGVQADFQKTSVPLSFIK